MYVECKGCSGRFKKKQGLVMHLVNSPQCKSANACPSVEDKTHDKTQQLQTMQFQQPGSLSTTAVVTDANLRSCVELDSQPARAQVTDSTQAESSLILQQTHDVSLSTQLYSAPSTSGNHTDVSDTSYHEISDGATAHISSSSVIEVKEKLSASQGVDARKRARPKRLVECQGCSGRFKKKQGLIMHLLHSPQCKSANACPSVEDRTHDKTQQLQTMQFQQPGSLSTTAVITDANLRSCVELDSQPAKAQVTDSTQAESSLILQQTHDVSLSTQLYSAPSTSDNHTDVSDTSYHEISDGATAHISSSSVIEVKEKLSASQGVDPSKTPCPRCGKGFKNLSMHKVCRMPTSLSETYGEKHLSEVPDASPGIRRSLRNRRIPETQSTADTLTTPMSDNSTNLLQPASSDSVVSPKVPCGRKFGNSSRHKVCRADTDHSRSQRESSATEVSVASPSIQMNMGRTSFPDQTSTETRHTRSEERPKKSSEKQFDSTLLQRKVNELKQQFKPYSEEEMECTQESYLLLKAAHDEMFRSLDNISTEKLSDEASDLLTDPSQIDAVGRQHNWNEEDKCRLSNMTANAKLLETPRFPWCAPEDSSQGLYNMKRLELLYREELVWRNKRCENCGIQTLLVGLEQVESNRCSDCLKTQSAHYASKLEEAWNRVKPPAHVPKCVPTAEENDAQLITPVDLPFLSVAERAVISLCQPVVTIQKHYSLAKTYKQESITLLRNPQPVWCHILPRNDLKDRFVVIERRLNQENKRYICVNPENVRLWLRFLFNNHPEYIRMQRNNLLELSDNAISALSRDAELANVICLPENESMTDRSTNEPSSSADVDAGLSETTAFIFDNNQQLYMKKDHVLKLQRDGVIKILEDNAERTPTYDSRVSSNMAFPDHYPYGESSPTDCGEHTLARKLLKKQTQWAEKDSTGKLHYPFAEDGVHMMHEYARLIEMDVRALVGWYISQQPERSSIPLESIIAAFKDGINGDSMINTQMSELHGLMASIRNSREFWFAERLGIETISRDLGDPNIFLTLNMDPRAWPDIRKLVYELEHNTLVGYDPDTYEYSTDTYTKLLEKYAVQINIYLHFKAKLFMRAFLRDICRIEADQVQDDCTQPTDITKTSWFWGRVEFTQTRGVAHWHYLAKLPGVLDTSILARMVQNMRIIRAELKFGNIKKHRLEDAWHMIEVGLLASRYLCLFGESISMASFFSSPMAIDDYDESKVVSLKNALDNYRVNYSRRTLTRKTNPAMRTLLDEECCNCNMGEEEAAVAAMCCIHGCMTMVCGGDPVTGAGCRHDFPKKLRKYTVPGVIDVNKEQVEVHLLLRRTEDRIPNLNKYLLRFFRSNHDVSPLVDAAHKMRYAAKYVSKSEKICLLLSEMIDFLESRADNLVPPTAKQALTHLLLADCSHKAYMTKHELSYNVLDLPKVRKSFPNVKVIGCYPRATIIESAPNLPSGVIELSDRTEFSAYAERLRNETQISATITKKFRDIKNMNFRTFAENINHAWIPNIKSQEPPATEEFDDAHEIESGSIEEQSATGQSATNARDSEYNLGGGRKFRTRNVNQGHWKFTLRKMPRHVRWSTVLYCEPVCNYHKLDADNPTSQCRFFDLDSNRRNQLQRCYQELVCYIPWANNPDDTFVDSNEMQNIQASMGDDPDSGSRYSLRILEQYFNYYIQEWSKEGHGVIAPPGSQWHRENQFNFTMYLANQHNRSVHSDRVSNNGFFSADYAVCDDEHSEVVSLSVVDDDIDAETPSLSQFAIPPDIFQDVFEKQGPPELSELHVAYPRQDMWQNRLDKARRRPENLFLAEPPIPDPNIKFTEVQQAAIDLIIREHNNKKYDPDHPTRVFYIYGRAGSGKTAVALHLCQHFKGHVQACAGTGKASSNFNGPTIFGAFCWGLDKGYTSSTAKDQEDNQAARAVSVISEQRLKDMYTKTEVFIFDEINAVGADVLGRIDQAMQFLFCKRDKKGKLVSQPFGGKTVIFMGDSAQLRPIGSPAIYDKNVFGEGKQLSHRSSNKQRLFVERCLHGQLLYRKHLMPNCIWFQRGHRNSGLLQEIMDRLREGEQTDEDLSKLLFQRNKYPSFVADRGIHYSNDSASSYNYRRLWEGSQSHVPPQRMHICKASYYTTGTNDAVVKALSTIPSSKYNFAQDVLCLAEGCEVRLTTNIDTAAGLVNSAMGTVVRIVYDDADSKRLADGELPAPHHIIVRFKGFRGRLQRHGNHAANQSAADRSDVEPSEEQDTAACQENTTLRTFPYADHELVDIYRQNFYPSNLKCIPDAIKKLQPTNLYRCQFPLDNSENLTVHRGQGQTWSGSSLSVHLGLESPDNYIPPDVGAIIYVACTRVTSLKDLLIDPIFPTVWKKLGTSKRDVERRDHEVNLLEKAKAFAKRYKFADKLLNELTKKPDRSNNEAEWNNMRAGHVDSRPSSKPPLQDVSIYNRLLDDQADPATLKPVANQRYIGIDQGLKTFTMVAVDVKLNELPNIVAATQCNLQEFGFGERASDNNPANVLRLLVQHTPLLNWMQVTQEPLQLPHVDRTVVLLEQISLMNKFNKSFGINLGKLLQSQAQDINQCIVQMSQPHIHRRTGPMFKLGCDIIEACNLTAPSYNYSATVDAAVAREIETNTDDADNALDSGDEQANVSTATNSSSTSATLRKNSTKSLARKEYRKKKSMSQRIFRYIINATPIQQSDMQLKIEPALQQQFTSDSTVPLKLDDYGDALLHALDPILCGSSNYRQLLPTTPLLNNNRTIALVILPTVAHWVVMDSSWNKIAIQVIGSTPMDLKNDRFSNPNTAIKIREQLFSKNPSLLAACTSWDIQDGSEHQQSLTSSPQIKIILKQLKAYPCKNLSRMAAGALTNVALSALQTQSEEVLKNARVCARNNRKEGWIYIRTCETTGRKIQLIRSSGKHTNGMLSCIEWMKSNAEEFVLQRPLRLSKGNRVKLFNALCDTAAKPHITDNTTPRALEHIELSNNAADDLCSLRDEPNYIKMIYADLVMIGLNANQQYISAVSTNFRRSTKSATTKPKAPTKRKMHPKRKPNMQAADEMHDGPLQTGICTCIGSVAQSCTAAKHMRITVARC